MRIEQLRYLDAILELGSFRAAADSLGVSQPTLSQQLRRLEEELDLVLVSRTRTGAVPTAEAQPLLPLVKRMLDQERALREEAGAVRGLRTGYVRLGSIASLSRSVLAPALLSYRKQFPNVRLEVLEGGSLTLVDHVRAGELDLGLLSVAEDEPIDDDIALTELCRDRPMLCVARDHPAVRLTRPRIRDLADEPWIVQGTGSSLRQMLARNSGGHHLNIIYQSNSPTSTLHLVAAGMGIAILGRLTIENSNPADIRRIAALPVPGPDLLIASAARKDTNPPPAVRELRHVLAPGFERLNKRWRQRP